MNASSHVKKKKCDDLETSASLSESGLELASDNSDESWMEFFSFVGSPVWSEAHLCYSLEVFSNKLGLCDLCELCVHLVLIYIISGIVPTLEIPSLMQGF